MPSTNPAGRIVPDVPIPLSLLDELGLSEAVALRDAYLVADAAHADALSEAEDLEDEIADRAHAARSAGLSGGKVSPFVPAEYDDGRREALRLKVRAASREVHKAAAAVELAVVAARRPLRDHLVRRLAVDHATAVERHAAFEAADATQRATASAIRGLDHFAAYRRAGNPHEAGLLAGAVSEHYQLAVDSQDPSRHREHAISQARRDIAARVGSLPVEGFTADPFDSAAMKAAEAMAEARRARTQST